MRKYPKLGSLITPGILQSSSCDQQIHRQGHTPQNDKTWFNAFDGHKVVTVIVAIAKARIMSSWWGFLVLGQCGRYIEAVPGKSPVVIRASACVTCLHYNFWINKKLCYRRGTARCVVSIKILPVATQQCRNYLYDKSWPNRWYELKLEI